MPNIKQPQNKKLVILDTHAILHRAYHAMPDFRDAQKRSTGALYGLTSFLIKTIKDNDPDYIVACYDLPEPTFRHEAYDNYKAHRTTMDTDLAEQINRSDEIMKAFGIPIYKEAGFEADDLLGTFAKQANDENKDLQVIIASGDLDTLQLVKGDEIIVFTPGRGSDEAKTYNEEAVKERYGFEPKLLPDYKGLKGDPSDNIIGVKGIGDKMATNLILNFKTLENMFEVLKNNESKFVEIGIKPRIINLLKENEEEALFSKTLAEIRYDAPVKIDLSGQTWKEKFNKTKTKEELLKFGFRTLGERVETLNI